MNEQNFITLIEGGEKKFFDVEIRKLVLKDQSITSLCVNNSTLNYCSLKNNKFDKSYLSNEMQNSKILKCIFKDTNLDFSDFYESEISESIFINCSLRGVNLSRAKIIDCSFKNCDFETARFIGTEFMNVDITNSHFDNIFTQDVKKSWIRFKKCDISMH